MEFILIKLYPSLKTHFNNYSKQNNKFYSNEAFQDNKPIVLLLYSMKLDHFHHIKINFLHKEYL